MSIEANQANQELIPEEGSDRLPSPTDSCIAGGPGSCFAPLRRATPSSVLLVVPTYCFGKGTS